MNSAKSISQRLDPEIILILSTLANKDFTVSEIAVYFGISPITVHTALSTARNQLQTKTNYGAIKAAINLGIIQYDCC